MGGFTKPADLMRGETLLNRQPGSPTAQKNKPI